MIHITVQARDIVMAGAVIPGMGIVTIPTIRITIPVMQGDVIPTVTEGITTSPPADPISIPTGHPGMAAETMEIMENLVAVVTEDTADSRFNLTMKEISIRILKSALLGFAFFTFASCANEANHRRSDGPGLHRHGMRSVGEYRPGAYHSHSRPHGER